MVYTCVISRFNVAEYESILKRRPSHLVLVVSEKMKDSAKLFSDTVKKSLPDIHIFEPSDDQWPLGGTDFQEGELWVKNVLQPKLQRYAQGRKLVCNFTGGTKAMTLSLTKPELGWHWLEYKAEGPEQALQILHWQAGQLQFSHTESLQDAPVREVAQLFSVAVEEVAPNPLSKHPAADEQAEALWQALSAPNTVAGQALLRLFGDQQSGFAQVWVHGRNNKKYDKKRLTMPLNQWLGSVNKVGKAELEWLQQWQQLAAGALKLEGANITFAGNKNSKDPFRRWLSGDWLELLVAHWLLQGGLAEQQLVRNVLSNPSNEKNISLGGRESDVLLHHKGSSYMIEIKANLPSRSGIKETLQQISSFGERAGRTNKILFIGPQLLQKLSANLDEIKVRCKADKIMLCTNKAELYEAVGL